MLREMIDGFVAVFREMHRHYGWKLWIGAVVGSLLYVWLLMAIEAS